MPKLNLNNILTKQSLFYIADYFVGRWHEKLFIEMQMIKGDERETNCEQNLLS